VYVAVFLSLRPGQVAHQQSKRGVHLIRSAFVSPLHARNREGYPHEDVSLLARDGNLGIEMWMIFYSWVALVSDLN
jgi:hypothetical protein